MRLVSVFIFVSFLTISTSSAQLELSKVPQPHNQFISPVELPTKPPIRVHLLPATEHKMPSSIDSNSPVFWEGNTIYMFNSTGETVRSAGHSLEQVGNRQKGPFVPKPARKGGRWIESIWKDQKSGVLYGWYHLEPAGLPCGAVPEIGAATSTDNGLTWIDQGIVLQNGYGIDCTFNNGFFSGGNGDFSVILDPKKEYFYFLFGNYQGPVSEQGIGIARSRFANRGQPSTVWKYFNSAWQQPGLKGQVTPIFRTVTGWKGPQFDNFWGPAVHWNTYLKKYVALLNRTIQHGWLQEGVYITVSDNLLQWSTPVKIAYNVGWYPQVIGLEKGETDSRLGHFGRLYITGYSLRYLQFEKSRR